MDAGVEDLVTRCHGARARLARTSHRISFLGNN
jgi:hypothetical protein